MLPPTDLGHFRQRYLKGLPIPTRDHVCILLSHPEVDANVGLPGGLPCAMGAAHHHPFSNALCTLWDLPSLDPSKEELPAKLWRS